MRCASDPFHLARSFCLHALGTNKCLTMLEAHGLSPEAWLEELLPLR